MLYLFVDLKLTPSLLVCCERHSSIGMAKHQSYYLSLAEKSTSYGGM